MTTDSRSIVWAWFVAVLACTALTPAVAAQAQVATAREQYDTARIADRDSREAMARASAPSSTALTQARSAIKAYKAVVLQTPTSGYCDDALWFAAQLGADAFARYGQDRDRQTTVALLKMLQTEYPTSPFVARARAKLEHLAAPASATQATQSTQGASATAAAPAATLAADAVRADRVTAPAPLAPLPSAIQAKPLGRAVPAPPASRQAPVVPGVRTPAPSAPLSVHAGLAPATPAQIGRGGFSIARQLGLRVGRVVIDPGHGGNDPGTLTAEITESAITLDIALKLEALLTQTAGVEVVLTRRSDVYVGLQDRTAQANKESADLFVSIHVNANRDRSVKGIETFVLNFASSPRAAAVASRENASSTMTMSRLEEVVKQIALTNKLDESRELAGELQSTLVKRLRITDKGLKDFGVRQAPFVVLIGAAMPSVLVEVAFLTNRTEGQLLATDAYRQSVAESLADGLVRYLRALKKTEAIAAPPTDKPLARLR
jgi:N-acetylmuramoyl-L-alanine amidase